jgi:antitoxin component of MazEF toxin-antitoxin module
MQLTLSRWGNSLAVRIPAELARSLDLEEGSQVECATTAAGTLELVPAGKKARALWLRHHFDQVNVRLENQPLTSPSSQLLREEERY